MSTHTIGFYEEMTNIIFQISSNMHLICSSGNDKITNNRKRKHQRRNDIK